MFFTGKEHKRLHQFRELTGMAELLIAGVQTPSAHSADVLTGAHRFCSLNPLQHGYREGASVSCTCTERSSGWG